MHPESGQRSVDEQEAKIDLEDDDEEDDLEEEEDFEDEEDDGDEEDGDESVEVLEPGILKSNHTKAKIMHPQSVKRSADEQAAGKSKKQKVVDLEEEEDYEDEDDDEGEED